MAKQKITEIVEGMLSDFLAAEGLELYNSEFIKEGKDWFLRVYIDKPEEEGYINTEDCEKVSRFLSERLDEEDPIEKEYYLEVSSPGMDRVLVKPEHYTRYVGKEVEVKLYKGKDGTKNIQGTLTAHDAEAQTIVVTDEKGKEWNLTMEEIAKTRLAVIF
ncbi:MAG: ribosome maturation factor RimP [Eubacterium sp.]|nr:ribosome maturation factor RimP [Candidatus Colimonas fimequi]